MNGNEAIEAVMQMMPHIAQAERLRIAKGLQLFDSVRASIGDQAFVFCLGLAGGAVESGGIDGLKKLLSGIEGCN